MPDTYSDEIEARLRELVDGLEADGYLIGADRGGTGYWVKPPHGAMQGNCGLSRFNVAKDADPELEEALVPFLERHRSYSDLEARVARGSRRESISA